MSLDNVVKASGIASALAADEPRRQFLRRDLRRRILESPLCDGAAYARSVEAAFREMWRSMCRGERWNGILR